MTPTMFKTKSKSNINNNAEIAGYGSAATWADILGRQDIKNLLGQTLAEEERTDKRLTELAQAGINQGAAARRSEAQFAA